jgi:hypothetical protein
MKCTQCVDRLGGLRIRLKGHPVPPLRQPADAQHHLRYRILGGR